VALEMALPFPVNDDSSDIIFDSSARVMKVGPHQGFLWNVL
jgi:hypothetical protein